MFPAPRHTDLPGLIAKASAVVLLVASSIILVTALAKSDRNFSPASMTHAARPAG